MSRQDHESGAVENGRQLFDALVKQKLILDAAPDLLDLARHVGGFDDGLLTVPDLNLLRATLREFRDQARAAIAKAEGR